MTLKALCASKNINNLINLKLDGIFCNIYIADKLSSIDKLHNLVNLINSNSISVENGYSGKNEFINNMHLIFITSEGNSCSELIKSCNIKQKNLNFIKLKTDNFDLETLITSFENDQVEVDWVRTKFALHGLKCIAERELKINNKRIKKSVIEMPISNGVEEFIKACCKIGPDEECYGTDTYNMYEEFYRKFHGRNPLNKFKNGWRATITIGRDKSGKLIRKQFYGKTKIEALNKANEYKNKNYMGILPTDDKITLKDWFHIWLYEYRINDLKPSSLSVYDGIYRNYIENSSLGSTKLKDLRSSNLQTYFNYLIRKEKKDANIIKNINKILRPCFSLAVKEQYLPFNPCNGVTLPKVKAKKDISVFTVEEQKKFIKSLENHRHKTLITLVFGTGLRIGEVLGLKWDDINFTDSTLTVRRTFKRVHLVNNENSDKKTEILELEPKTSSSKRTVPIPTNILKELHLHKKRQAIEKLKAGEIYIDNNLVFPNEIGEPTDTRNLTRSY